MSDQQHGETSTGEREPERSGTVYGPGAEGGTTSSSEIGESIGVGRPYDHASGNHAGPPAPADASSENGPAEPEPPSQGFTQPPAPGTSAPANPAPWQPHHQANQTPPPAQPQQRAQPQPGGGPVPPAAQAPAYWQPRPNGPAEPPPSPMARRRGVEAMAASASASERPAQSRQPVGPPVSTPTTSLAAGGSSRHARTPERSGAPDDDDTLFEGLEQRKPIPRTGFQGFVYKVSKVNLGPSKRDIEELGIRERLNRQLRRTRGYCGYIGIASEKGGVGKTTLAALLATEIAEGRRESVGVADLNPDLGTLPDRFGVRPHHSIRDLLAHVDEIPWRYHVHDFMEKVPEMNVRVLAASTDRKIRHQLSVADVELLAELFAPFFSFAILDNGTHITHEAMLGTLKVAHGMVLVTDNTKDGANLARKTLQFLTDNGYPEMRRRVVLAVIAKETASPVKVRAIDRAFRDHVRDLIIVPYDPALDGGGKIPFRDPNAINKMLRPQTREAVRRLAAIVIDDLVA